VEVKDSVRLVHLLPVLWGWGVPLGVLSFDALCCVMLVYCRRSSFVVDPLYVPYII